MSSVIRRRRKSKSLYHWLPGLKVLQEYKAAYLPHDIRAGLTLGLVMVPVGLAFGELAGSPLAGLYAEIFPLVAYALFGTSRQLIVGPGAAMAAFVALSVAPLAMGDPDKLVILIALISIMIGILCIAGSFLRLGFFADFLSNQVVVGFMHGLALVIAVSQLPLVLGFEIGGGTTLKQFFAVCNQLDQTHFLTMAIGLPCAIIIILLHKWYPAFPGQIVVLVGAILVVHFFSLEDHGIAVVGQIPVGLPDFQIPLVSFKEIQSLIAVAFAAAIVAFSDTMANSRGFADRNHYRVDSDQELLALGMGNIFAGVTQSLPVSGSGTRTSVAEAAGSKTQVTSIIAALVVALVLIYFSDLLYSLPMAALGGVLLAAAWNLINIKAFKRMWEYRGIGLISAVMTLVGVVSFGIIQGIGIGVLFSLVLVVRAVAFPTDTTLGKMKDQRFRDEKEFPEAETVPGIIVYRFSGILIFANSGTFRNRAEELISDSDEDIKGFVLDASSIIEVDLSACEMLSLFHKELEERGIRLIITKLRKDIRKALIRGWIGPIDRNRIFKKNNREAVASIHQDL